jgi:hypothetical protein
LNALGSCLLDGGRLEDARQVINRSLQASAGRPEEDPFRAFAEGLKRRLEA